MDEQVELLRAICSEMKALNGRVDTTNVALHGEMAPPLRGPGEMGSLRTEARRSSFCSAPSSRARSGETSSATPASAPPSRSCRSTSAS